MRGLALRKPKLIEIPRVSSGIGMIIERTIALHKNTTIAGSAGNAGNAGNEMKGMYQENWRKSERGVISRGES
jgi:hypothetical protein